jgi:hypothetical protein
MQRTKQQKSGRGVSGCAAKVASAAFLGGAMSLVLALAEPAVAATPDPHELLRQARVNQVAQEAHLEARLRQGRQTTPFLIRLQGGEIRYEFADPSETVLLRLGENGSELLLETAGGGGARVLRSAEGGERVRGSSLTYEDLALRFLYWPGAKYLGTDTIRTRSAHRLELHPHDRRSLYAAARVWIDQASGALLRVEGYDWEGRLLKRFEVVSAQKIEEQWFLRTMRVETFDPATRKVTDRTYLDVTGLVNGG